MALQLVKPPFSRRKTWKNHLCIKLLCILRATRRSGKSTVSWGVRDIHPSFDKRVMVARFLQIALWESPCCWYKAATSRFLANKDILGVLVSLDFFSRKTQVFLESSRKIALSKKYKFVVNVTNVIKPYQYTVEIIRIRYGSSNAFLVVFGVVARNWKKSDLTSVFSTFCDWNVFGFSTLLVRNFSGYGSNFAGLCIWWWNWCC